ncbi:MAG: glycosyltransferase family 4 protein [Chitinophagaceae bacterium]|nr:glycosyltransferase family 4 protein [Chitinophagaceae bacterium]
MKIIHVLSGLTKGGGERVAVELANAAAQNGDVVSIIAGWPVDPEFLQKNIDPKVDIKFVAKTKQLAYLNIAPWIINNRKWISGNDVLHCHLSYGAFFGAMASILLKKFSRNKKPVIIETYHAVGMQIPKIDRWIHSRMMLFHNGVAFMAKDPFWDKFMAKHPASKTGIIPNGIKVMQPQNNSGGMPLIKDEHIISNYKYVVGTVGMLRPDRKPGLYIPIFLDIYKALGEEVHFILAGGGSEFENIKSQVNASGLTEQVSMPGLVNNPLDIIAQLTIYVSVSVGDTAGISMIEAAMCGIPVVGIQLIENYKANENDWVWSDADGKEVAKKIIFLLQNPGEREKLVASQNVYVKKHFTADAMYAAYDAFYKKILAG